MLFFFCAEHMRKVSDVVAYVRREVWKKKGISMFKSQLRVIIHEYSWKPLFRRTQITLASVRQMNGNLFYMYLINN